MTDTLCSATTLSLIEEGSDRRRSRRPGAVLDLLAIAPGDDPYRTHATADVMTGLLSRAGFLDAAERALLADEVVSVLVCELRGLSRINELCGQRAGDRAIADSADLVRRSVRSTDVCARTGGGQLTVLLRNVREPEAQAIASRVAQRVATVRVPASPPGVTLVVKASAAVTAARPGERAEEALARAAEAVRAARSRRDGESLAA